MRTVCHNLTWSSSEDSTYMFSNHHAIAVIHSALDIYGGHRHGSAVPDRFCNSKFLQIDYSWLDKVLSYLLNLKHQ